MRADCRIDALIGDRAYKGKKPITTNFLDFSSPDSRERACAREVELNRRLAPDSYLGVVHLSDPSSRPDEPVVVMRREREGFAPRPGMLLAQRGGNHIVQDIGGGNCALYAHLRTGSLTVKSGDQHKASQIFGQLGTLAIQPDRICTLR
jgi:hypothetical protein